MERAKVQAMLNEQYARLCTELGNVVAQERALKLRRRSILRSIAALDKQAGLLARGKVK